MAAVAAAAVNAKSRRKTAFTKCLDKTFRPRVDNRGRGQQQAAAGKWQAECGRVSGCPDGHPTIGCQSELMELRGKPSKIQQLKADYVAQLGKLFSFTVDNNN